MKISWNHLQSFFTEKLNKPDTLHKLTMAGLEIEDEYAIAPEFSGVVIGQVVTCEKHPDADKLSLCTVNVGTEPLLQIICGANNVAVGIKVPVAVIGAVLPDNFLIAERKMRGIVSQGMLCSGSELGCDDGVDGLLLLPENAPIGTSIREYLDLDDSIIELKITPNRGDALSYNGLAREVAVLNNINTNLITAKNNYLVNELANFNCKISETIHCPSYYALKITNVNNTIKTPAWLKKILERSNIKSISPIVDITNYVLIKLGQPMHAFDVARLHNGIGARMANNGEKLTLLDNSQATLTNDTLVIVDGENQAVAIAGVMGGLNSSVTTNTTDILLESAFFTPEVVAGKAKKYGVSSDAAFRYERGVDYQLQTTAINLAAELVLDICGGEIQGYTASVSPYKQEQHIIITLDYIRKTIGTFISDTQIITILKQLGCNVEEKGEYISVNAPSYRFDINIKEDLVEEVARVFGYENIAPKMPVLLHEIPALNTKLSAQNTLKAKLINAGFNEIISYAFIEEKFANLFANTTKPQVKLQNPIAGLNFMRNNLVAGLIKTLENNVKRGFDSVKLFELARVFYGEEISKQPLCLAGLMYGNTQNKNWAEASRKVDFFDLKFIVEELCSDYQLEFAAIDNIAHMHPSRTALIKYNGATLGYIGQLHPKYIGKIDLNLMPYLFELNLELLETINTKEITAISKYQKVSRDLAFIINSNTTYADINNAINQSNAAYLVSHNLFDVYEGDKLEAGQKSLAINFVFQALDKTLSDDEIVTNLETIRSNLINKLQVVMR